MVDWYCYESKAGSPIYYKGEKITSPLLDSLEGEVVQFHDGLTGQRKGHIIKLLYDWHVDDGSFLWNLVFEEGYWGVKSGVNYKAIQKLQGNKND